MAARRPILLVQGAQWGSEAKGAVSLFLCERRNVSWTCRTGSINAGHTIHHNGKRLVFQQLPVGAVLPGVKVAIGAGAYVHHNTFLQEVEQAGCEGRVYLDGQCGIHLDAHQDEATQEGRNLRIGATGKGCAEAIIHKIKDRGVGEPLLYHLRHPQMSKYQLDVSEALNAAYDEGEGILIEGTQGTLLDLHHGPYPFTTSRQTISAAWVTELGLSPALDYEVVLVARTFPIRVAGNSGPMGQEITWPDLARAINAHLNLCGLNPVVSEEAIREYEQWLASTMKDWLSQGKDPNSVSLFAPTDALKRMSDAGRADLLRLFEATTVTKRLRRIAHLDVEQLAKTVRRERPAYVVLTFLNYVFPELCPQWGGRPELQPYHNVWLRRFQSMFGCWIRYVTVGPRSEDVLETPSENKNHFDWQRRV